MKIFLKLQLAFGDFVLKRKLKHFRRIIKVHNFKTAKRIGIIFNATKQEDYRQVSGFIKDILEIGIGMEVKVLGFVNNKDVPNEYLLKKNFSYFLKRSLNWYRKPVNSEVERFLTEKFDILIDFSLNNDYLFNYIMALSPSRFKVGKFREPNNYYDFMISINKDKDLKYFIEQVRHYLEMINRPELSPDFMNI
ncbi:MAG: hypothetical protein IIB05_09740 [Bacteroidetes bacterium]|nr:hypothetical protein [Bacteroidota bacterium]